jgi:hypothetical protein
MSSTQTTSRLRHLLTGSLLAAVTAALAGPAYAASAEDTRDASRDVVYGPYFTDALPTKTDPARRLGDITRTRVSLGTDLVVTTKFRSLAAVGQQQFEWLIKTSVDQFNWTADLYVQPGKNKGRFELIDPVANQPGCGKAVLDRPGRTVTLTIPADCLGDPSWVRVGNGVYVFIPETRIYVDDARRDGGVRHGWKYGPKVTSTRP